MKVRMSIRFSMVHLEDWEALTLDELANTSTAINTDVQVPVLFRVEPLHSISDAGFDGPKWA